MKYQYRISVGIMHHTKITVTAETDKDAFMKARHEMDDRYAKEDREAPVAWDLTILTKEEV